MALKQAPVAAKIIYVNKYCILFMNHDQDAGDNFGKACIEIFSEPKDIKNEFPESWSAMLYNNFILLDTNRHYSESELLELLEKLMVDAIVVANSSNFNAYIFVGKENKFSKLLNGIIE